MVGLSDITQRGLEREQERVSQDLARTGSIWGITPPTTQQIGVGGYTKPIVYPHTFTYFVIL